MYGAEPSIGCRHWRGKPIERCCGRVRCARNNLNYVFLLLMKFIKYFNINAEQISKKVADQSKGMHWWSDCQAFVSQAPGQRFSTWAIWPTLRGVGEIHGAVVASRQNGRRWRATRRRWWAELGGRGQREYFLYFFLMKSICGQVHRWKNYGKIAI